MDPIWVIWKGIWLEIIDGTWMGDLEGYLVRNLEWTLAVWSRRMCGWRTDPGWGNCKNFWLEIMMARHSGDQMEVWLGCQK